MKTGLREGKSELKPVNLGLKPALSLFLVNALDKKKYSAVIPAVSKVGDHNQARPEDFLFHSYYSEV